MRFASVDGEKANHSVLMLCRVLRFSKSGYYAWKPRGLSKHARGRGEHELQARRETAARARLVWPPAKALATSAW